MTREYVGNALEKIRSLKSDEEGILDIVRRMTKKKMQCPAGAWLRKEEWVKRNGGGV